MNTVITSSRSSELFRKALNYMPGGVNSPVRAFKGVGGEPIFFTGGRGAYLTDVDGQEYIDYVGSWGPMILGHAHPSVIKAVKKAAEAGLSFGAPCALEIELAETICQLMPHLEKIRCVNSGTEATMTAIRLARGVTARDKLIKFEGCYHGHSDSLLVKAGSGALTLGVPSSPGVPSSVTKDTLVATFNDLNSVEKLFAEHKNSIAAVIIEPIAGNMNLLLPTKNFLTELRRLCDHYGALLIFDEVMTGFRVALGGAHSLYAVTPDITTLGKVIGGGMPVGALGGKKEIMDHLAPAGPIYQAGTLSGNPIAMAAGIATLKEIQTPYFFENLSLQTNALIDGLKTVAKENKIEFTAQALGGMFGIYFTEEAPLTSYQQIMRCNSQRFNRFFHGMLKQGVYFAPSSFEAGFVSSAHGASEIKQTILKADKVFFHEVD